MADVKVDVKQAVKAAADYIRAIYAGQQKLTDLRLEEVQRDEDDGNWLITFGFTVEEEQGPTNPLQGLFPRRERVYKIIEVDGKSGEPIAMRIRVPV